VEAGVGAGDETGMEVRRITGGTPTAFPPKLTLGLVLGTVWTLAESDEINEMACSGGSVVVVGGSVSEG